MPEENVTVDYSPLLALVLERKITLHPKLCVDRTIFTTSQKVRDDIRSELLFWEKGDTPTSEITLVDDKSGVSETSTRVSYYGLFITRETLSVAIDSLRETVAKYSQDKRSCHLISSLSRILDELISKLSMLLLALIENNSENSFGYISNGNFIIVNPGRKTFNLDSKDGWFVVIGRFDLDVTKIPTGCRLEELLWVHGLNIAPDDTLVKGHDIYSGSYNSSGALKPNTQ